MKVRRRIGTPVSVTDNQAGVAARRNGRVRDRVDTAGLSHGGAMFSRL